MVDRVKVNRGLTDADWDGEAPAPGSSDKRYSDDAQKGFKSISDRVAQQLREAKEE